MIPKIIHYCWFGNKDKPQKIKKCIESWKSILHGYEFIEWNEKNFEISEQNKYVQQAYESRKYAFVSDVARIEALYKYGGIYLDTDVEVKKSFDELLDNRCLLGFEEGNYIATSFMAAEPGHPFFKQFALSYDEMDFIDENGLADLTTNVVKMTDILSKSGLKRNGEYQLLEDGIAIYPQIYFSPYDYISCFDGSDENTYCVHYFYVTWMPVSARIKKYIKKLISKLMGKEAARNIILVRSKNGTFTDGS